MTIHRIASKDLPAWAQALVIEDGVPIPHTRSRDSDSIYYAVKLMKVGQSFVVPYARTGSGGLVIKAGNFARATGHKFIQRTFIDDSGDTMLRIWRTE